MLYVKERVNIPQKSTYAVTSGSNKYLYLTIASFYNEKHQQRHRQCVIGKLVTDPDGVERLIPNDNYYKHFNVPKPLHSPVKKSGPERRKTRPLAESRKDERIGFGYALAVMSVMTELGIYHILEEQLDKERAMRAAAIVAFYVQCDGNSALTKFPYFVEDQMAFLVAPFDGRWVCEEFDRCDESTLDAFVRSWMPTALMDVPEDECILYDVTSISTTAEDLDDTKFAYNRDHEDLEQNNIGCLCTSISRRPLMLTKYDGSINDSGNFNHVLRRCRELGISDKFDVICDGTFDPGNIEFTALNGHGMLTATSHKKYKEVRRAILEHIADLEHGLGETVLSKTSPITLKRIPFSMGKTTGSLIITLDYAKKHNQMRTLIEQRDKLRAELTAAETYPPGTKKYEKLFKLTKDKSRKGFTFEENTEAFREELRLCGANAFYSTRKNQDSLRDLYDYRAKDVVEKMFGNLKNDLMDGRLYVHSEHTLVGKMFYLFLSLIVYKEMERRFDEILKGPKKLTMDNCFTELKRIKFVKSENKWHICQALNSQQKKLYKAAFTFSKWAEAID